MTATEFDRRSRTCGFRIRYRAPRSTTRLRRTHAGRAPVDQPPVDRAIDAGWVRVLETVDYSNPAVSATMDMVRRYIAAADDRAEHEIEQADGELGGATATLLENGTADAVAIYTNDVAAFRGIERAMTEHGYDDRVQLVDAFDFYDAVRNRYGTHV